MQGQNEEKSDIFQEFLKFFFGFFFNPVDIVELGWSAHHVVSHSSRLALCQARFHSAWRGEQSGFVLKLVSFLLSGRTKRRGERRRA
jgi:hypothetical protein